MTDDMKATLEKGSKFAVEPKLPPPEKLSMVRGMADMALPRTGKGAFPMESMCSAVPPATAQKA